MARGLQVGFMSAPRRGPRGSLARCTQAEEFWRVEPATIHRSLDLDAALQRFEGDSGALKRRAMEFVNGCPEHLAEIRRAIEACDAKALSRAAYRLDWHLGLLSAGRAFEAALRLEQIGREDNLEEAAAALEDLEREIGLLADEIRDLGD